MIFLFPRWDMLVPWRVIAQQQEHQRKIHSKVARHWHLILPDFSHHPWPWHPNTARWFRHPPRPVNVMQITGQVTSCVPFFEGLEKDVDQQKDGYLTCLECFCVDLLQVLDMIFLAVFAKWFHLTHWWRCKSSPRPQSLWELCYTASTGVAWPFANGWPHKTILLKCCEESYRTPSVWCMFKRENQCLQ